MNLKDSFNCIFKKGLEEIPFPFSVEETKKESSLNELSISDNSGDYKVYKFPLCYYQDFQEYKQLYNRKNCDGVYLIEKNSVPFLLFVELKSTFSTNKITDATEQIVSSFLKSRVFLSVCKGAKDALHQFYAVIAIKDFKSLQQSEFALNLSQGSLHKPTDAWVAKLLYGKGREVKLKLKDLWFLREFPLSDEIGSTIVYFKLFQAPTNETTFLKKDISEIL